jgi:hypothetical protein
MKRRRHRWMRQFHAPYGFKVDEVRTVTPVLPAILAWVFDVDGHEKNADTTRNAAE